MKIVINEREFYGIECHFKQYFSYIVVVSFIGGGQVQSEKSTVINEAIILLE